MALVLKDRVKETATSPGIGSVTLLGASTGFQSFAVIGNGNTCYYTISDQGGPNWEVGIGTYSTSGPTLARTTVLSSSNSGSLTDFNAGSQDVFVTYPAEQGLWLDASDNAIGFGTPASFVGTNITGTATALSIGGNAATATTAGTVTTNANLTGPITSVGNATSIASQTGTGSKFVVDNTPTLITPLLGTPTSGTLTNCTGYTYANLAGTVPTWNQDTTGTAAKTNALNSATTVVNVSSSAAPTTGQALVATSGTAATWQTLSAGAALSNDTSTATQLYPMFAAATTGTPTTVFTSDAKYLYKPSTGELSVTAPLAVNGLFINNMTVNTSYTIPSGYSASSVGPVTIAGGVAVTVPSGSRWLIL
jgi:hypothetical protein